MTDKPGATPETAFSVHAISTVIGDWLARLGTAWVEGQVAEANVRRGLVYLRLRDVDRDETIAMHMPTEPFHAVSPPVEQGSRLLVQVKVVWWPKRGDLQFKVLQMRTIGLGELMARLEALRGLLAAEGLFAPERKRPLPFLPRRIGLICGQNSDAMHDVVQNALRRWPDVEFVIREVAVQGPTAARAVTDALTELDAIDDVDVIVITRGGGSFEDLLPFSDETLIRAVANSVTPVVAAIGHEEDKPLIDYVADVRASTPTDAARCIVPDVVHELAELRNTRAQLTLLVTGRLEAMESALDSVRTRPALASPVALIDERVDDVTRLRIRAWQRTSALLDVATAHVAGATATLRALSPQGTLLRGYSIVRDSSDSVVASVTSVGSGDQVRITVSDGDITATVA